MCQWPGQSLLIDLSDLGDLIPIDLYLLGKMTFDQEEGHICLLR